MSLSEPTSPNYNQNDARSIALNAVRFVTGWMGYFAEITYDKVMIPLLSKGGISIKKPERPRTLHKLLANLYRNDDFANRLITESMNLANYVGEGIPESVRNGFIRYMKKNKEILNMEFVMMHVSSATVYYVGGSEDYTFYFILETHLEEYCNSVLAFSQSKGWRSEYHQDPSIFNTCKEVSENAVHFKIIYVDDSILVTHSEWKNKEDTIVLMDSANQKA